MSIPSTSPSHSTGSRENVSQKENAEALLWMWLQVPFFFFLQFLAKREEKEKERKSRTNVLCFLFSRFIDSLIEWPTSFLRIVMARSGLKSTPASYQAFNQLPRNSLLGYPGPHSVANLQQEEERRSACPIGPTLGSHLQFRVPADRLIHAAARTPPSPPPPPSSWASAPSQSQSNFSGGHLPFTEMAPRNIILKRFLLKGIFFF